MPQRGQILSKGKKVVASPEDLNDRFRGYCGTEYYHMTFPPGLVYTDGVKAAEDELKMQREIRLIAAEQPRLAKKRIMLQVWNFVAKNGKAKVTIFDDVTKVKAKNIKVTEMPDGELTLWVMNNTILLPSEY